MTTTDTHVATHADADNDAVVHPDELRRLIAADVSARGWALR